jgi:hypothetical protein
MFLVAGGSFSLMPSSSGEMMIWHPRRDLIRPVMAAAALYR